MIGTRYAERRKLMPRLLDSSKRILAIKNPKRTSTVSVVTARDAVFFIPVVNKLSLIKNTKIYEQKNKAKKDGD